MGELKPRFIGREKITREIIEREISSEFDGDFRTITVPNKAKFNNGGFITVFQRVIKELAKSNLTKNELKMLFYLIGTAGAANILNIDLDTLCVELSDNKGNISRTINSLTRKHIIIKATRQGARNKGESNMYELSLNFDRLNYELGFKGKVKDYKQFQYTDPKIITKALPENQDQLIIPFGDDTPKTFTDKDWQEMSDEFKK